MPSTGGWRGEIQLRNRNCNGRQSVRRDPLSAVAQFLSSLDSNRLRESAVGVCTEVWPAVRDAHAICGIFA